jgi:DNA-directed RNA polymerase subunit M/transcription elongation factor TFIIS
MDFDNIRQNARTYFNKMFQCDKTSKNVEIGIYNYSVKEATLRQVIKKWTNPFFYQIYTSRLRTIYYNLKTNHDLFTQVKSGQITPEVFSSITHQEMNPFLWKDKIDQKIKRDRSKLTTNIEASTDMFCCKKCKSKRCTYYELQTRSADESATIFITCLDCGKNWRN